ncbi:hypothetical protein [Treponema denticola]|uniref:hypothetical protein n=1 Tax=Treponema denticola TaxID=158 RepID=UPI0020A3C0CE|nr:hypothetical protein [Treponema denticola]UTC92510.1 hypothetical protein E4N84_05165 [Treponema denticola]
MNQKEIFNLLTKTVGQSNILTIPTLFLKKLDGNHAAALFLSQLVYWTDKTQDGWIFKSYSDWENEIFVKEKKLREIKKELEELGLIETKIQKAYGVPTVHYKVNQDALINFLLCDEPETAETKPPKSPNGNGQDDGSDTVKMTETKPPKSPNPISNIDYNRDYNVDYTNSPQSGEEPPKRKIKKPPLRLREPKNDLEVVEKEYLKNWDRLFNSGKVKTKEPLINWIQSRALLKNLLEKLKPEDIAKVLAIAAEDNFILSGGYNLNTILSANVLNRLLNAHVKTPEVRQSPYRKSAEIASDRIKPGAYL